MPHVPEQEKYLASYVALSGDLSTIRTEGLNPDDFAEPGPFAVIRVAEMLEDQGEPITPNTIQQLLKQKDVWEDRGGQEWWSGLIGRGQDPSGVETAIRYVQAASTLREMGDTAETITDLASNGHDPTSAIDDARQCTTDLLEMQRTEQSTVLSGEELGQGIMDLLTADEGTDIYLPTGFPGLDRLIDGLKTGRVNVVAARSNHGKSAWCDQLMLNVARRWDDKKVLKFDLENTERDQQARLAANLSGVPIRHVQQAFAGDRDLETEKAQRVMDAADEVSELPIIVDSFSSADSSHIRSRVLSEQASSDVGLVIVDYITQMGEEGDGSMDKVMNALTALHALAKDMEIPVVVVAQINRKPFQGSSPEPQIHHLMWSDELAQKPAQVLMLHHPHAHWEQTESHGGSPPDPEKLFLFVRKNKGGQGVYEFKFDQDCLRILDPKDPQPHA